MKRLTLLALFFASAVMAFPQANAPVRIAIIGLAHDHARGMIPRFSGRTDAVLVGIVEPDRQLAEIYSRQFHLPPGLFFPTLESLLAVQKVDAAALFTSTLEHRAMVEQCAGLGIDVMMEKPMATTYADAVAISEAARKGGIQVVVNYETTWYGSVQEAYRLMHGPRVIGDPRKFVVHDGHEGPKAIGCSPYFLDWLTDPIKDGGGAVMDFGCYGADLVTWFMDGRRPTSVFAALQHLQPDVYPKVDDEATIVVTYPRAQAIIQASWNWPYDRKDMEIYGQSGSIMLPNGSTLLMREGRAGAVSVAVPTLREPNQDPLSYLVAVARKEIVPSGPSSLAVNLVVCEILDAAKRSAQTGCRVEFGPVLKP